MTEPLPETVLTEPAPQPRSRRRFAMYAAIGLVVVFGAIQLVPIRVANPSTRHEPAWDTPQTRRLAVAACFDCHSNQTNTFWWEDIAPLSWWITNHVDEGRRRLNFSECTQRSGGESGDAAETVTNGSMPPSYYTWLGLHSSAKLSTADQHALAAGLRATLSGWSCGRGG